LSVGELAAALAAAQPGGGSAFVEEIIRRFEPLLRYAWRRGGFDVEYSDFVQQVFTELFAGLPALKQTAAFPGYLRRVALSVAARFARRASREAPPVSDPPPPLEEVGAELFARAALRTALDQLPRRERQVVEGLFLEEHTAAELASRLGLDEGSVRMAKSRAIKRLRKIFESEAALLEGLATRDDAKPPGSGP
jgi:RNA polymerase sigma-70 factor, ECF subfamily